jgi:DNA replication and repair protein RecF
MIIQSLRLHQFRNYRAEEIHFPPSIVLLHGRNGQGKTNVLEALYLCSTGKSYRGIGDTDLIHWDEQDGSVIISFIRSGVEQHIKIILSKVAKKELWVNETRVTQRELLGTLNEVLFSPEDLQLVKGSPALRRRFMDMEISQVNPAYYHTLMKYNRAITQRNLLLKKMKYEGIRSLAEWDQQIAEFAAFIVRKRLEALHKIGFLSGVIHRRLTEGQEKLTLSYEQAYFSAEQNQLENRTDPSWYYELLQKRFESDVYHMSTSIGPHRDDLSFFINGSDVKKYGSQGQQRTAVLSLKLSELEYIKSEAGEYPVLLLDDVMSELDEARRKALLNFVRDRIQTFITTTDPDMFRSMEGCSYICLEGGRVQAYGQTKQ